MTKYRVLTFVLALAVLALGLPGCQRDSDRGPVFSETAAPPATAASANADVRLSFVVETVAANDAGASGVGSAREESLRPRVSFAGSAKAAAAVTVKLISINCGDTGSPTVKMSKTANVGSDGRVDFVFTVPTKTTVAQVSIEGGTINGFSDFQGAADLVEGANVIVVNPLGSRLPSDLTAQLIMQLVNSPTMFAKTGTGLATQIRAVVAGLDTRAATVYYDAINLISQRVLGMNGGWTGAGSATTGIGITWKGALAAAPGMPMLNWV